MDTGTRARIAVGYGTVLPTVPAAPRSMMRTSIVDAQVWPIGRFKTSVLDTQTAMVIV